MIAKWRRTRVALGAVSGVALALDAAAAGPLACDDRMLRIGQSGSLDAAEVCTLASGVRHRLTGCGLTQSAPLTIKVLPGFTHAALHCIGHFDCTDGILRMTDPASYPEVLRPDDTYALPPGPLLFRAVLTHEMSHALVAQMAGEESVSLVDQEYIAAAMELEFMDPHWRDVLLKAAPVDLPPQRGLIDIWIYRLEPRKFATNAWQHFHAQKDGCHLVREIATGKATLGLAR